jgi:hypothetical protein
MAAGVAFFAGFAAGVAFLAAFVVFGVGRGRSAEAAEREGGKEERERFHKQVSFFLPKMDGSDCGELL